MSGGWGAGSWGTSEWGVGSLDGLERPVIFPVDPKPGAAGVSPGTHVTLEVVDADGINLSSLNIAIAGTYYVLGGNETNGAKATFTSIDNGYHVQVDLPGELKVDTSPEVFVTVLDNLENLGSFAYSFNVGNEPSIIRVGNPKPNILRVYFNKPMKLSDEFFSVQNWRISPVSDGARELRITDVRATEAQAEVAILGYEGGGSTYELSVHNLLSSDGRIVAGGKMEFDILYEGEDPPTVRLFDTVFGPLGMSQRSKRRRTIEGHVINRSIAIGMDEQFRLRLGKLGAANGRPGSRRT